MKFNETKSQERLINLMLQAGVEWPLAAEARLATQQNDGEVWFWNKRPRWVKKIGAWDTPISFSESANFVHHEVLPRVISNYHTTIITREQYEARDGWVTWHGGECPVDGEVEVMVMLESGNMGGERHGGKIRKSRDWCWSARGQHGIIAYRIHKPAAAEPCESVAACIPDQPTIEQLIAECKRLDGVAEKSREIADKDREAFDRAAEAVEEALKKAGWN